MKFYLISLKNVNENQAFKNWGYLARFLNHTESYPNIAFDRMHPDTFKLKAKAKAIVTDFMYFDAYMFQGLLFNTKVKDILKNFNLPPYHNYYHDISIEHKKEVFNDYHYLVLTRLPENPPPLDFAKTKFCIDFNDITNRFNGIISCQNYQEAVDKNAHLREQAELWLTKEAWQYDIIKLPRISAGVNNVIISEKLANALVDNKVTGIELIKADWIHAVE
jgi:hypothetical protein